MQQVTQASANSIFTFLMILRKLFFIRKFYEIWSKDHKTSGSIVQVPRVFLPIILFCAFLPKLLLQQNSMNFFKLKVSSCAFEEANTNINININQNEKDKENLLKLFVFSSKTGSDIISLLFTALLQIDIMIGECIFCLM